MVTLTSYLVGNMKVTSGAQNGCHGNVGCLVTGQEICAVWPCTSTMQRRMNFKIDNYIQHKFLVNCSF